MVDARGWAIRKPNSEAKGSKVLGKVFKENGYAWHTGFPENEKQSGSITFCQTSSEKWFFKDDQAYCHTAKFAIGSTTGTRSTIISFLSNFPNPAFHCTFLESFHQEIPIAQLYQLLNRGFPIVNSFNGHEPM